MRYVSTVNLTGLTTFEVCFIAFGMFFLSLGLKSLARHYVEMSDWVGQRRCNG